MRLTFAVSSLVETMHLSGEKQFLFHGGLAMATEDASKSMEPMQMAFVVPKAFWMTVEPGETIEFEYSNHYETVIDEQ